MRRAKHPSSAGPKTESKPSVLPSPSVADFPTIPATEAQNEFGRVMEQAIRDQTVVITRHNVPKVVLLSVERYRELAAAESTILDTLTDEFDAMLARMQAPSVRAGIERGFSATPSTMGKAAQKAARQARKG